MVNMIPEIPSRSAQKREDEARQKLALRLVGLTEPELARLQLSPELADAVRFAASRPQRGARRREMLHVSAILRREDTERISQSLEEAAVSEQSPDPGGPGADRSTAPVREPVFAARVLRWKDALLRNDESVLEEILGADASADLSRLRQLARNARKRPNDRSDLRLAECLAEIDAEP